jgi:hypothetical protein
VKQGVQNVLENAGKWACYLLCLFRLAGKPYDSDSVEALTDKGLLQKDFTVRNAGAIFSYLTGQKWAHTKEGPGYQVKPGELMIYEWYYEPANTNHFRLADWDPLESSRTVNLGKVRSTRVLRRAG